MDSGAILILSPKGNAPWEGGQRMQLQLEGFSKAAEAEASGRRLVQALLWTAIQQRTALQLQYESYEPAYIFERNRSLGMTCNGYMTMGNNPQKVIESLHKSYVFLPEPQPEILLSMEIFAGARLETSERAKYLLMVSSLEPLAKPESLGVTVDSFVADTINTLKNSDIEESVKNSLMVRVKSLREESIGQSLRRLVKEILPEITKAPKIINEAYAIRSQLAHSGQPNDLDIDLTEKSREIEEIIIAIYQKYMTANT